MAKDWSLKQTVKINNVTFTASMILPHMEEAEVTSFCALLEGGYEVKEINETLSDMTAATTNVATSNPMSSIAMYGEQNQGARISPFSGSIHFKNTVTNDDIKAVLGAVTPFALLPTAKPEKIYFKGSEEVL